MLIHNSAPFRLLLVLLGAVCFGFAAFGWSPPFETYRTRLIAAGLLCWVASTFFD